MIAGKVNQAQNVIIAGIKGEGEKKGKKREQYAPKIPDRALLHRTTSFY